MFSLSFGLGRPKKTGIYDLIKRGILWSCIFEISYKVNYEICIKFSTYIIILTYFWNGTKIFFYLFYNACTYKYMKRLPSMTKIQNCKTRMNRLWRRI